MIAYFKHSCIWFQCFVFTQVITVISVRLADVYGFIDFQWCELNTAVKIKFCSKKFPSTRMISIPFVF